MKNELLILERTYNAPSEKVWKALTDSEALKQWSFDILGFKAEVGFEFQLLMGKDENNQYLHICKVTEVIPGKKLTYSWRYDGYAGMSYVTFELFPEGEQTRLKFTHAGIETFPADNPDFAKENFAEGWTYTVDELKAFIESPQTTTSK
jgi:uncharacterized protein YndB with AHSA1/START domain